MPPKKDLPCAACGSPMWRTRTSAPEGVATCHPCRRRAHGLAPNESVNAAKAAGRISQAERRGPCQRCGGVVPAGTRRWKFCSDECHRKVRNARGSGAVSKGRSRDYGPEHQQLRAELLPSAYGTRCHLCGDVMEEGQDLHLDHTEDRTGYRGMAHASCNVRDGARRSGEAQRRMRLETGWRVGQDPSTRRRPARTAA